MDRRSKLDPVFGVAMSTVLLFTATVCGAATVAYNVWGANRERVMVIEDTGGPSTEIYRGLKFSVFWPNPTISPPMADGTWVGFNEADMDLGVGEALYKVRSDGTGLVKVLCSSGTFVDESPYEWIFNQQWSPDGSEILVQTDSRLALLPASFAVGPDCGTPMLPIFEFDWGGEPGWALEGTAAWNDDASRIAFFEVDSSIPTHPARLVILDRAQGWQPISVTETDVELFGNYPLELDWQRGGGLLAFTTRDWNGHAYENWLTWIDSETGEWGYFMEAGSRLEGSGPTWSPDGSHLIFTDGSGDLVKWSYPDGPGEALGTGREADWQRAPLPVPCGLDSDCDDGNPCTDDVCNGGLCESSANTADCDDGNPCTYSDVCGGGACSGTPIADGSDPDCDGWCCDGECLPGVGSCEVDCSSFVDKWSCNAEPLCHWDNRNGVCVLR